MLRKFINHKLILFFFLLECISVFSQNDTLVLKNKDRLIGEIKKMENGVLTIETDYSDSDFKVTWLDVVYISSSQYFLITITDGERLNSFLKSEAGTNKVNLNGHVVEIKDIVYIKPVKTSFISRLDASLSFGLNFTKANNLKQLTVRSTLGYTANVWNLSGSFNSVRSNQDNTEEIQRTDANIQFKYFFKNDVFFVLISEFLSNDEQKLDLRMTNRAGVGKYFTHTNHLYFGGGAGLAWNNEKYTDPAVGSRNSVEGFLSVELNLFDVKDFSLLTNLTYYPSITEKNRHRLDYKLDLKYDLPLDFFIKLGVTYNFDNQPVEGASKDDYVFQATFGWEL